MNIYLSSLYALKYALIDANNNLVPFQWHFINLLAVELESIFLKENAHGMQDNLFQNQRCRSEIHVHLIWLTTKGNRKSDEFHFFQASLCLGLAGNGKTGHGNHRLIGKRWRFPVGWIALLELACAPLLRQTPLASRATFSTGRNEAQLQATQTSVRWFTNVESECCLSFHL